MNRVSVYVCEPQPVMFEGLLRIFERTPELHLAGSCSNAAAMLRDPAASDANVALVGQAPGIHSALAVALVTSGTHLHGRTVIWVNEINEADVHRSLQAGITGVLFRSSPAERLVECLLSAGAGKTWLEPAFDTLRLPSNSGVRTLTPRQREIARLVVLGHMNAQIAAQLGISMGTLKVHLTHIYGKLGVSNRIQLALQGHQLLGIESTPESPSTP